MNIKIDTFALMMKEAIRNGDIDFSSWDTEHLKMLNDYIYAFAKATNRDANDIDVISDAIIQAMKRTMDKAIADLEE